uniref:NACHT-NTPase and P-loop NTPases N-terminal domain-containing protein n=1 Tax=Bionectria ochroleuca TaxID=29856 RepID=A0A8H7KFN1_BIOOC
MEVVGVIASSVTLLEVSLKTAGFLQEMASIQDDFRCLQEVIADIDSIAQAFHSIPSLFAQGSGYLPQVAEPILIARAISQLEHLKIELDEIIINCARSSDSDGSSKAKKRKWVLIRNRIPKLLERVRDARSNLQTGIKLQSMALDAIRVVREHRTHLELKALIQELQPIQQLVHSNEQGEMKQAPVEDEEEDEEDDDDEGEDEDEGGEVTQHSNSAAPSIRGVGVIGAKQSYPICQAETAVTILWNWATNGESTLSLSNQTALEPLPGTGLAPADNWDVGGAPSPGTGFNKSSVFKLQMSFYRVPLPERRGSGLALALRPARVIDFGDDVHNWAIAGSRSESFWMTRDWIYFPDDHVASGQGLIEVAISNGQFAVVEFLLSKWQNILQHRKFRREVAFLVYEELVYMDPEEQVAEVLSRVLSFEALDKEPWALNELDYTGECPIHAASKAGNKNAVEDLIQANASVNMKDPMGQTALILASFNEHVDCVRLLLRHSDINIDQRDNEGWTALFRAASVCDPEVVAALLAEGASLSVRDIDGKSPLHRLGDNCTNHERIKQTLQLLLASGKINIDAVDNDGVSTLMQAIFNNRVAPLRCLVEAGASMQLLDKYGHSVLHIAAVSDLDVLQYLLGLDPTMFRGINPNQLDAWLDTPWDDFQDTLSPNDLDYREKSSHEASEAAFDQLLQIAQDVNLRWEIDILESTLTHVRQSRVDEARSQLNSVIVQRKRWKDDERVRYYRGISQQIQAGDFEGVITALEEEIEDLEGQIGSDITSSEEEDDHTDGGEDGDDPYETAESGDEAETEDTGTAL